VGRIDKRGGNRLRRKASVGGGDKYTKLVQSLLALERGPWCGYGCSVLSVPQVFG
jgi:hypothetical protein